MDDALEARIVELEERLAAKPDAIKKKAGRVVEEVLDALDTGKLRVCEPTDDGWVVHPWVKRAILLSFGRFDNARIVEEAFADTAGPLDAIEMRYRLPSYYDKLPTKRNWKKLGARCVPGGIARYGSYLGKNTILMPAFVNIGAYVDDGTMVDTWATVGSCAQIGKDVHLSGGVGIGGVLEPPQAHARDRRGRRVHRLAVHRRRGRARRPRGGARRGRRADRVDADRRRARRRAGGFERR